VFWEGVENVVELGGRNAGALDVCDLGLAGADKGRNVNLSLGGQVVSGLDVTRAPPFEAGDWKEESQVQILGGVTVQ
jgi:hypothetical protein